MSEPEPNSQPWQDWIDDYLHGALDEAKMRELEERLRADPDARRYFVRYARLHTDLHLEMRARQAGARALDRIERMSRPTADNRPRSRRRARFYLGVSAVAACVVFAISTTWWLAMHAENREARAPVVAWLVNAQNCEWSDADPLGNMRAGNTLQLERGLAEIRFDCGARVVLEGPAKLELLSGSSARLMHGKLTARVPEPAAGFAILSPQGKVIDFGTEFGVSVADTGATDVYVFEGKVVARPVADGEAGAVSLTCNQSAHIAAGKITVEPNEKDATRFVRAIVPPPVIVPRTLRLAFERPGENGIRDANGAPTGLTHRLPGTGARLPEHDPNLKLDAARGRLELTTTKSDINTQHLLSQGEYLGVRLSDLGFTGKEDFAVTVTIPDIPALEFVGQFGLYAGSHSKANIRGGVLSASRKEPGRYTQFLVNNDGGNDSDINEIGLLSTGTDLRLTLKRVGGKYSLTVENLTAGGTCTLTIPHPAFLDGEGDLYVGLFGANTQSEVRRTLVVKEMQVTVWTQTGG
jgi:ferric-dicitrate binding protein FerR (iron transport regulator)